MKNKLPIESDIIFGISEYTFELFPQIFSQPFCSFEELHTFPILLNNLLTNIYTGFKTSFGNLDKVKTMEVQLIENKEIDIDDELSVKLKKNGKIEITERG